MALLIETSTQEIKKLNHELSDYKDNLKVYKENKLFQERSAMLDKGTEKVNLKCKEIRFKKFQKDFGIRMYNCFR